MRIQVQDLTRSFGQVEAVSGLSLQVGPGEVIGLIGPNGAGKTTTLRTLAGILRPSQGRVLIDGYDLATHPIDAKARLAFMPDEPHLFEYLTVLEHVQLVGRLYSVRDVSTRARQLFDELELTGKEGALPGELSRGMRQKVVVACGLVREASVLLFDEPLTGLDPIGIRRMRGTIADRAKAGAGVILSSHLLHLVEEVCTRIVIMDRGRKVADGSLSDLTSNPALTAAGSRLEDVFLSITGGGRHAPQTDADARDPGHD